VTDKTDLLLKCIDCGDDFFTEGERDFYLSKDLHMPKRCKPCRGKKKARFKQEKERIEFEKALAASPYKYIEKSNLLKTEPDTSLFIIGNGFDLMHGVKSSYYSFRDTLGKNNSLRFALETYLNVEDLWADFEDALAHIDRDAMFGVVDMWLDDFDAYNPDAQAADFFAAVDTATGPSQTITQDLPRRFRMWVESLKVPDLSFRPLIDVISNSKTLNFNYTEFIEDLYGVDKENICYIHGCRRKVKYQQKEKLILGHVPGAGDTGSVGDYRLPKHKSGYKRYMMEAAVETAARNLSWYDDETTKYSKDIIKGHQEFFDELSNVSQIIVIGHSLSPVDWDYFKEIISVNQKKQDVEWYFSCHSPRNIESIKVFSGAMGIEAEQITLFIT